MKILQKNLRTLYNSKPTAYKMCERLKNYVLTDPLRFLKSLVRGAGCLLVLILLLSVSYLGFQSGEWIPIAISACGIALIILADRVVSVSVGNMSIELQRKIDEAEKLFEGLKQLADTMSSSVIKQIAHGTWNGGQDKYDFYHDILMFDELRKNMKVEEYDEYLQERNLALLRTIIFILGPMIPRLQFPATQTEIDAHKFREYVDSCFSMKSASSIKTKQQILSLCEEYKQTLPVLELERIRSCAEMLTVFDES